MEEKICGMTFNMYYHVFGSFFQIFDLNEKKSSRIAVSHLLPTRPRAPLVVDSEAPIASNVLPDITR